MKDGLSDIAMHPVAEAILAAEASLSDFDNGRLGLTSAAFYRVLSLSDIAAHRSLIPNIETRLAKLTGDEWKQALHELVTACSYISGPGVEFIPESITPTPDILLKTTPLTYIECKTRLKHEEDTSSFKRTWKKEALVPIQQCLTDYKGSFLVRITLYAPQTIGTLQQEIPSCIREMVSKGLEIFEIQDRFQITIEPWSDEEYKLPSPMSPFGREMWELSLNFKEWDAWHDIHRDGHFRVLDRDQRFAVAVGKRMLICVRAEYLKDNRASLLTSLKDACRRQLKAYNPGIIFIILNAQLLGLSSLEGMQRMLNEDVQELFRNYDRVWKIIIDVISSSEDANAEVSAYRFIGTNSGSQTMPNGYIDPRPMLIV